MAYCLRANPVRDADRRYTIFTEAHGKITILAKGSRKSKSKMSAHLASFGVVDLMVARGRLTDHLAGADLKLPARTIIGSLPKMSLLQSMLLAADAFTRRDQPEPRLFKLLGDFIITLDTQPEPHLNERSQAFASFTLKLTDILGFALELDRCVRCRQTLQPIGNALNVIRGGIECRRCRDGLAPAVSSETIKALRYLRGAEPRQAWRLTMPSPIQRELKFVTELVIATNLEGKLPALRYFQAVG
jgi:DNA repair protein RecO (recombination protein O)